MRSLETLLRYQRDTGFQQEVLEKAYRMIEIYQRLLSDEVLHQSLTLKGGTALNFIYLPLPRLSVDLDFDFTGALEREAMLQIKPELVPRIVQILKDEYRVRVPPSSYIMERVQVRYLSLSNTSGNIKIEINFLNRLPVDGRYERALHHPFNELGTVRVMTYSLEELLAMKVKTLLERTYPRDLFDVYMMIQQQEMNRDKALNLMVYYSCMANKGRDFLDLVKEKIRKLSSRELERELAQLIPADRLLDAEEMRSAVIAFFEGCSLSPHQREFLEKFYHGDIQSDVLFAEHHEALDHHPALLFITEKSIHKEGAP
jgi:predicted nucleotidyltransferase component of viral defense system